MKLFRAIKIRITRAIQQVSRLIKKTAQRTVLPGFEGLTLYDTTSFFYKGMNNGTLTTRASAIAYNFFLAVFPAIIVLFTMIPYIPIENFQSVLMTTLEDLMPANVYSSIQSSIQEIVMRKRNDLLSFGFILSLFFASGGIAALINAFNASFHNPDNRTWLNRQGISLVLILIFCMLISLAVVLIIFSGIVINFLEARNILTNKFLIALFLNGKWLIILISTFFSISFLYYFAPAKHSKFRFFSPGSILSSFFIILTSVGFSAYINNFGTYNKFYGSIGTLIAFLIWLFVNSLVLLIGFELNINIHNARKKKVSQ
ncbi:MAG: YihY/virulence factor BrkB family protein [Bacteroidales bacterium]|jgi:membrane protein